MNAPACITPFDVAQAQLEAYNAQDLDGHCACFADDVVVADLNGAITVNGFQVPALTVRRTETTVELGSGQSMMIAGLMSNNAQNTIDKAPGAGDRSVRQSSAAPCPIPARADARCWRR